ncbi:MarR family winged helix-turn-helix transcriptional regulator [Actinoplanes sp. N902-109]|uniref:MarR family winged helix-turn-helix transcriptional regulator n=1 Tax=Actinoplanes sp. (strain N902-109) TaxID=649831 RepID=UPI00032947B0|nr:MarR family winged helix-turn-helix transcriptional regulator [Actinoplanes sp. N902-109]AGL20598.1 MarR family transcriptional regulator [Actinoplanes sp. N902-109]
MAANERLIADIMTAQQQLQQLFVRDRADPLFETPLTMQQLKILMLLHRTGDTSGRELAGMLGVSLATLSGMVDRLVAQDMVTRTEDPHDRRVRRISLSDTGHEMIDKIVNAGTELQLRLLGRLTADELGTVLGGLHAMIRAANEDPATSPDPAGRPPADAGPPAAAPGPGRPPAEASPPPAAPGRGRPPAEASPPAAAPDPGRPTAAQDAGSPAPTRRGAAGPPTRAPDVSFTPTTSARPK